MPIKGQSPKEIVHTEMHKFKHKNLHSGSKHGPLVKSRKQAIAVALSESGQSNKRAYGGKVEATLRLAGKMARGGDIEKDDPSNGGQVPKSLQYMTTQVPDSWTRPPEHKEEDHPMPPAMPKEEDYAGGGMAGNFNPERGAAFGLAEQGTIKSEVPGRTDKLHLNVPAGSYILPADIPSALGEGNTFAGSKILDRMFKKGPYGINPMKGGAKQHRHFARGGSTGEPLPIIAAGGEYIIHPETIHHLGGGDVETGHKILDAFVKHVRSKHIKTLRKLKPPKGSK